MYYRCYYAEQSIGIHYIVRRINSCFLSLAICIKSVYDILILNSLYILVLFFVREHTDQEREN